MSVLIAVIDYGAGNLRSIRRALEAAGAQVSVTSEPTQVRLADAVVFPGVGAAGASMDRLHELGLDEVIGEVVAEGRPFLGICLGMQLLFEHQEEGNTRGLGLLQGRVQSLSSRVKVPQIGWNRVRWIQDAAGYEHAAGGRFLFCPFICGRARRSQGRRRGLALWRCFSECRPPPQCLGHAISPGEERPGWSTANRQLGGRGPGNLRQVAGERPGVILYPAIDIRGGRCVRLIEGDFSRETRYDADPSTAAERWAEAGAEWLHVVDLDGAIEGRPINRDAIAKIRAVVDIPIQLGGGLRSLTDLDDAFGAGMDRLILGTVALRDPELVISAVSRWNGRIAVALDARDGRLATDGWLGQSDARAVDVAQKLTRARVANFIYTDISRDGTLTGPNLEGLKELIEHVDANVIASGGIASLVDLEAVAAAGATGAIVGRAIYDGRIDLRQAISVFHLREAPC